MRNSLKRICLMAGMAGMLLTLSACTLDEAQQWLEQRLKREEVVEVELTPEPQETSTVGSKKMDAMVDQQPEEKEDEGSLSPSGKSYAYYDTVEPTYINGVLLVNKEYALPRDYGDGEDPEAYQALQKLQRGARRAGYSMSLMSGFRSFDHQEELYTEYVAVDGVDVADTYSAWPGHSEHQTGLAFDVGWINLKFANTGAGKWLAAHAHEYGFIIRYPEGKEDITGYQYEPWHIRYLGVDLATDVYESGLCLEEYLGVA